ncbi:MAG: class I lanthipeptide [Hyphomicrobiales bacterium]
MKKLNFRKETISVLSEQMQYKINGGLCSNYGTGCHTMTTCPIFCNYVTDNANKCPDHKTDDTPITG